MAATDRTIFIAKRWRTAAGRSTQMSGFDTTLAPFRQKGPDKKVDTGRGNPYPLAVNTVLTPNLHFGVFYCRNGEAPNVWPTQF
jgi:hypothetical protein